MEDDESKLHFDCNFQFSEIVKLMLQSSANEKVLLAQLTQFTFLFKRLILKIGCKMLMPSRFRTYCTILCWVWRSYFHVEAVVTA
jgi:hypothetical protein